MVNDKIEKRIAFYHKYLDGFVTPIDAISSDPELVKLRHHVLFVHTAIESLLYYLIVKFIAGLPDKNNLPLIALHSFKISPFLDGLDFHHLCEGCKKVGLMDENQFKKIMAVNNHRRSFAHPNAYEREIKKYKNRAYYLEVLKDLADALIAEVEIYDKFDKSPSSKTPTHVGNKKNRKT